MTDSDEARHCREVAGEFTFGREGFTDEELAGLIARERADAVEQAVGPRETVTGHDLLRRGGAWLGAARNWLKWHKHNGDRVTWGSHDVLEPPFTVAEVEDLAATAAAAAMGERSTEQALISARAGQLKAGFALWRAEERAVRAFWRGVAAEMAGMADYQERRERMRALDRTARLDAYGERDFTIAADAWAKRAANLRRWAGES